MKAFGFLSKADPAAMAADTLLITVPTGMGVDENVKILDNFATYVAPELGWQPNTQGPSPATTSPNPAPAPQCHCAQRPSTTTVGGLIQGR